MSIVGKTPWLVVPRPNTKAELRLFCLPFAGGGASAFREWPAELSNRVELVAVQPPGREERFSEPCFNRLDAMVDACMKVIILALDRPCVLYGHSMGARIAFEIAKRLQVYGSEPRCLIVSGARAPHFPKSNPVYDLPDELLTEEIRKKNGTPDEILRDREMMQLLLPRLRADYTLADTAPLEPDSTNVRLKNGIVAMGGLSDPDVSVEQLTGWGRYASGNFTMHLFEGDHFFIQSSRRLVLPLIDFILSSRLGAAAANRAHAGDSCQGAA